MSSPLLLAQSPASDSALRFEQQVPSLAPPGLIEKLLVIVTTFTLLHGIPPDWFRVEALQGNLALVGCQLALIGIAVVRVIGSLDHLLLLIRQEAAVFIYLILALCSFAWSADPGKSLRQAILLLAFTLFALYLFMRFDFAAIVHYLSIMYTLSAVVSLGLILTMPQFGVQQEGATSGLWTGLFYSKNILGFSSTLAIPLLIVAGRFRRNWRIVFYPATLLHLVLLIGSGSVTSLAATICSVAMLFLLRVFRGKKTMRGAIVMALLAMASLILVLATANLNFIARAFDRDVSLTGRIPLWIDLWDLLLERPWLGHGYRAAFGGEFSPIHEIHLIHTWEPPSAHNAPLHFALELGIIGMIIAMFVILKAVRDSFPLANNLNGSIGLWPFSFLSTVLLVSITEAGIAFNHFVWMILVIIKITATYARRNPLDIEMLLEQEAEPELAKI